MEADYSEWNLENTAKILNKKYTESCVWVIKPTKMILNTYSSYENFVNSGVYGIPEHKPNQRSWVHLKCLIYNALQALVSNKKFEIRLDFDNLCELPIYLVGFSKGCVVLNQLIYDLSEMKDDEYHKFARQVKKMIWLDAGHSGTSNTWVTNSNILRHPVQLGIELEAHVTPYQIKDSRRPWIGKEYLEFVEKLQCLNANLVNKIHFENKPALLDNHFNILKDF